MPYHCHQARAPMYWPRMSAYSKFSCAVLPGTAERISGKHSPEQGHHDFHICSIVSSNSWNLLLGPAAAQNHKTPICLLFFGDGDMRVFSGNIQEAIARAFCEKPVLDVPVFGMQIDHRFREWPTGCNKKFELADAIKLTNNVL